MASLRELQGSFAAALRDPAVACQVMPPANLDIYRNNVSHAFRSALEASFPVLRRRVGDEYFGQLAHHYREAFPSRSGDLHFVGQEFAGFLQDHLRNGDYAWLADLARLEWAREEALISPTLPAVGAESLSRFGPEQLEDLVFTLQPSLRLHFAVYPVFSIWRANQDETAPPMDQLVGEEHYLIHLSHDCLVVRQVEPSLYLFLTALVGRATLGDAMERAGLDGGALSLALGFAFNEQLVTALSPGSGARSPGPGTRDA
jgi:hypothetical protein